MRDIKNKSEELRKETVRSEELTLMIQNLVKLDRGDLPATDPNFTATTEKAKLHGAKAITEVTEENETAQKKIENARAAVIKMRSQLQAISNTSKSSLTTGNDIFMKNNR